MRASNPNMSPEELDVLIKTWFKTWFFNKIQDDDTTYSRFKHFIRGPGTHVCSFKGCIINGYRFTSSWSNSGVLVKGSCYGDDTNNYYGRLEEVLKLTYEGGNQVLLFKCHWYDNERGVKIDRNKVVRVDITSRLRGDDIYILASQASQVYYARSVKNPNRNIFTVINCKKRSLDENIYAPREHALQEEVSNTTLIPTPNTSLFVDYTIDDTDDEEDDEDNMEEDEEEEEEEENDDDDDDDEEEEEEDDDGYDV